MLSTTLMAPAADASVAIAEISASFSSGFVGPLRSWTLAASRGWVVTLTEGPAALTHPSVAASPLAVPPGLVRLSVGIEHVDDLIADLEAAVRSLDA